MDVGEFININGSEQAEPQSATPLQRKLKKAPKLTIDQLRKFPELLTLSEDQVNFISDTLFLFSQTFYELYAQLKSLKK